MCPCILKGLEAFVFLKIGYVSGNQNLKNIQMVYEIVFIHVKLLFYCMYLIVFIYVITNGYTKLGANVYCF